MSFFTARKRPRAFPTRPTEQAEAEAAEPVAAPYDSNQSPDIPVTPDIATINQEIEAEMSTPEHTAIPVLTPGLQAKIDAVVNRAVPPAAESATAAEFIATISDPGPAPSVEPQTPPEDEPKRGRGRPRPMETIVRDGKVYDLLKAADEVEGVSKEALAISLGEKEQQVYSSLRQLTKEGRAETRYVKGHGYRWFAL